MIFICQACNRSLPLSQSGKVRCACGAIETVYGPIKPVGRSVRQSPSSCIHRSDQIGRAECDCSTKPPVYRCDLHGEPCVTRKPVSGPMLVVIGDAKPKAMDVRSCHSCPQKLQVLPTVRLDHCAVITTHYNPVGFSRLDETMREWLPTIGDVILERGELRPENVMWQKERLINRGLAGLPADVRYVCWCDHDICFENPNWLVEACRLIDAGAHAVQPFDAVKYRGPDGKQIHTATGATYAVKTRNTVEGQPGACWVASRQWLDSIGGLYDRNIVGGGDAVFFEAVSGQRTQYRQRQSPAGQKHLGEWVAKVVGVKIEYVPGAAFHLWHGDLKNRQYVSRDAILRRFDYDDFRAAVAGYFAGRREDG
jgi:hypothetical protein